MFLNLFFKLFTNVNMLETVEITSENFCKVGAGAMQLIGKVLNIIEVVVPVVVVIFATVDLGKAVLAGDEKQIKTAQSMLIKRLIFGSLIFFAFIMVKSTFKLITEVTDATFTSNCWNCVLKPNNVGTGDGMCDKTCVPAYNDDDTVKDGCGEPVEED